MTERPSPAERLLDVVDAVGRILEGAWLGLALGAVVGFGLWSITGLNVIASVVLSALVVSSVIAWVSWRAHREDDR